MKSNKRKIESLKKRSKSIKALEFEKIEASPAIAAHEETNQDLCSRLDHTEAALL